MSDQANSRLLIEKSLKNLIAKICVMCKLGIADWDFNESLRSAIQTSFLSTNLQEAEKLYNDTFELAKKNQIDLDPKYYVFYKLNHNKKQ